MLPSSEADYENVTGLLERSDLLSGSSRRKRLEQRALYAGHPGSQSTPVSPDHLDPATRGPMRKQTSLKLSPTSAFSALTPAVSFSEFSDTSMRVPGAPLQPHHYFSLHSKHFGSNLIKTRSEMSLTNPSPPPGSYCTGARRYPSPSRSHSQHFGKLLKPSPMLAAAAVHRPPKPASGYLSDSSSLAQDAWSLPPNPACLPALRAGRPVALPSTTSPASAFRSLERRDSHFSRPPTVTREAQLSLASAAPFASRTKSPRSLLRPASERLRVKSGSAKSSVSSCNGSSSSTLQEDLLKLISPEYRSPELQSPECSPEAQDVSSSSGADTASTTQYSTPYSSLERPRNGEASADPESQEIVTLAQPAHVVAAPVPKPPRAMPQEREIDWPSLVDTATRAMALSKELRDPRLLEQSLALFGEVRASGPESADSVRHLEQTVERLQSDLMREQEANARLKQENDRLQQESQTAAAQLRKFTQWFFANVNAK